MQVLWKEKSHMKNVITEKIQDFRNVYYAKDNIQIIQYCVIEKKLVEKKEQVKTNSCKNPKEFKEDSKVPNYKDAIANKEQKSNQSEEIKQLKDQIALLQETVQQLSSIVQAFVQSFNK
ncbi:hypothetical protein RFI_40400 [Reticulomyxa filosa]|uniref:Uncharacterized protein n=1 Tax=Reticulomyxa filosa TaxID=46433 RepID=X6L7X8_RETFI|nr:hypothetical protein RFI_40400 [Reticulomyxa filosa]|eukprot:ETN97131.1 hypothetical protein RFI_40400 [Reticulomyxa filosa]